MRITGKCHCGNIAFGLEWDAEPPAIPARACGCSFCAKHGGVWTSDPKARLTVAIRDASLVSKYAFGSRTATFHVCSRCGIVPVVTSEIANHLYAVVNVGAMENIDESWLRRVAANFEGVRGSVRHYDDCSKIEKTAAESRRAPPACCSFVSTAAASVLAGKCKPSSFAISSAISMSL